MVAWSGKTERLLHHIFEFGLFFKGLFATFEVGAGAVLYLLGPGRIFDVVHRLTLREIAEDPADLLAGWLLRQAQTFNIETQHFYALYLSSHGAIKLLVVIGLALGIHAAYPVALVVFVGFVIYQAHLLIAGPSVGIALVTLLDLAVIWLTWHEYAAIRRTDA